MLPNWKFMRHSRVVFTGVLEMPHKCSHCKQGIKLEPRFYTAALWISYQTSVFNFYPNNPIRIFIGSWNGFFKIICPLLIHFSFVLQIPIIRISRAILLNMTIDYATK